MKKVLVVLTNTPMFPNSKDLTGLWLSEATEFVNEVTKNGYSVDYVSCKGGYVPIDPRSMKHIYIKKEDIELYSSNDFQSRALANSLKPSDIKSKDYEGIYFTGGHGVMFDFFDNKELQNIALEIYKNNGYIMSVCHGIAGLLNIKDNGKYLIDKKHITGFTTSEEILSGKTRKVPFFNQKVAKQHGALFVKKMAFRPFAIQDGNSITGQNPQSAKAVAIQFLKNK